MPLTVGTNAYLNATDASAYFADRLRSTAWTSASATERDQSLMQATRLVNTLGFRGDRLSDSQPLAWPRSGTTTEGILFPSTTPQVVLDATCEVALVLLSTDLYADDDEASVRRVMVTAGPVSKSTEWDGRKPAQDVPAIAKRLLSPYLTEGGSGSSARLVP